MSAQQTVRPPADARGSAAHGEDGRGAVEVFLGWIAALAPIPSQFGGLVYIGMNQVLSDTVTAVAVKHSGDADFPKR